MMIEKAAITFLSRKFEDCAFEHEGVGCADLPVNCKFCWNTQNGVILKE
jgi:hypothetical protein